MQTIVREEGAASLYNGLSAGCARQLVYMSARIGFYEKIRDAAAMVRETDFAQRLVVGAVSGGIAAVVSCPMEVTVVRMSNDASLPAEQRRGPNEPALPRAALLIRIHAYGRDSPIVRAFARLLRTPRHSAERGPRAGSGHRPVRCR